MNKQDDLLIEILTEELPPKSLRKMGEAFLFQLTTRLQKAEFSFKSNRYFATPRRLALFFEGISAVQPDQIVERKGPALTAAYDANGKPSKACEGFARSCGVTVDELIEIKTPQGAWVGFKQHLAGKSIHDVLPQLLEESIAALPVAKRMRWGEGSVHFVRPVHKIMLLFGEEIIHADILGIPAGRVTVGNRLMAPDTITIPHPSAYETLLETEGFVLADFMKRRDVIANESKKAITSISDHARVQIDDDLLDEVTGLVEWPVILVGRFDERFLKLPPEILISAMQNHQRYFPVKDAENNLQAHFIIVSNLKSHDENQVIHGNERVLRARLSDAEFFYLSDKKEKLENHLQRLKGIIFQAKLGSIYERSERLAKLSAEIAALLKLDVALAQRAGMLAKTDLVTAMVNEFPELQGIMGEYYARHDGENKEVAIALREQYLPRFSGDGLPQTKLGQVLGIADRIDLLVGIFGINEFPTGEKDPFGLRRAAVGVLRILIEKKLPLDLKNILQAAISSYQVKLANENLSTDVLNFMQERLRSWYAEQGVTPDVFAAVSALNITSPLDMHERIRAVQAFKKLKEAETLSIANKRVSNILAKYDEQIEAKKIDPKFFENESESILAQELERKSTSLRNLFESQKYEEALVSLAELRTPIDNFFDHVMVMTEDKPRRENRLLLLSKLRSLFLQVADIALLQESLKNNDLAKHA